MEAMNVASRKRTTQSELENKESRTSILWDRRLSIRPASILVFLFFVRHKRLLSANDIRRGWSTVALVKGSELERWERSHLPEEGHEKRGLFFPLAVAPDEGHLPWRGNEIDIFWFEPTFS